MTNGKNTGCVFHGFFEDSKRPKDGRCGGHSKDAQIPQVRKPGAEGPIPPPQPEAGQLRGHQWQP